ncbi:RNA helicase Mov10l1 isoform X1 [Patella vulgata]|uniref:RNA helicase Mov10l1 isoform X1 n=2 Tax=Patella vulgata TaxID=6465 RepID=UPI00217F6221|nr:RNA helicase Mov10l1 isoform X1 [Patella vulgata]XP_050412881.1 RNA helicase Mov10l1 isoform X1 [Patella vulgata]
MLTLIGQIIDYMVPDADDEEKEFADNLRKLPVFEKEKEVYERRQIHGEITQIFNGQGLIDHEVYFSFYSVSGEKNPKVGDKVSAMAIQTQENGGWLAESVTLDTATWQIGIDNFKDGGASDCNNQSAVVGKVASIQNGKGRINENVIFDIEDGCLGEFKPFIGDWVKADVFTHSDVLITAENVEPLRSLTVNGEITLVKGDHGYINGDTFFTLEVCLNSYKPKKWDPVRITAIESEQGKCEWRATCVAPRTKDARSLGTKTNVKLQTNGEGRWTIPGQRPKLKGGKMILPKRLDHYPVPDSLRNSVIDKGEVTAIEPALTEVLDIDNYVDRFSALLHLEEIQYELDIREFDLSQVCLRHVGRCLGLAVTGLAEGRPSVLMGDKIILSIPGDPDGPYYEGFVHEVLNQEVLLKFSYDFHNKYNGEDYDVEFTFNRTSLRRCHQGIRLAVKQLGIDFLFPLNVTMKTPQIEVKKPVYNMDVVPLDTTYINYQKPQQEQEKPEKTKPSSPTKYANINKVKEILESCNDGKLPGHKQTKTVAPASPRKPKKYLPSISPWIQDKIVFINPDLNDCQKMAVIKIVLGQSRPLPYIIFGPPGTGKTITVVESMLQILLRIPSSRIVACTPSNSAADLLIERLYASGQVKVCDMVRLNSFHRKEGAIPDIVLPFSASGEDLNLISRHRIVVCTCNMAGSMFNLGLKVGHFTHAFVDEAGQATEPECLIPLGLVSGADGQIVLAGDPKQLGPVLMSPDAKLFGLELSLLERLMERQIYCYNAQQFSEYGGFDPNLVTMLIENYRSHPSILHLPSKLFYFNQLKVKADPSLTHTLVNWSMLPTQGVPVVFHGIRGEDLREGNSPSWFNPGEAVLTVQYLQSLIKHTDLNIDVEDIGIITPYRKQIEKIRLLIEKLGIERVKVGSVEEFQGQERQVVIISTVRSNEKLLGLDLRHVLGFLSNPKRFNVAITRAQAALVIIGNPFVLIQDENWRQLIQYCVENGAYTGCDVPDFDPPDNEHDESH